MNIFNIITKASRLIGLLEKNETPKVGKDIEKAGKYIRNIGGTVNLATISMVFGSEYSIDDFINHWESAPIPTTIIAVVLVSINLVPQMIAYKYRAIGKSQTILKQ